MEQNKDKHIKKIEETLNTIRNFRKTNNFQKQEINVNVLTQIIEEFSEVILYLLKEKGVGK